MTSSCRKSASYQAANPIATPCKKQKLNNENCLDTHKHITVYTFPSNDDEKQGWIKSIPLIDRERVSKLNEPLLFINHWPVGFPTTTVNRKTLLTEEASVFEGILLTDIPTPQSKPRKKISTFFRRK